MGSCERRGEDDPADAGKRAKDFHVTLLLPCRLVLRGQRQSGERGAQAVDLAIRHGALRHSKPYIPHRVSNEITVMEVVFWRWTSRQW